MKEYLVLVVFASSIQFWICLVRFHLKSPEGRKDNF